MNKIDPGSLPTGPLSNSQKWRRVRRILLDPTVLLSVLLAALGAVLASTNLIQLLIEKHPLQVGVWLAVISVAIAVLRAILLAIETTPPGSGT